VPAHRLAPRPSARSDRIRVATLNLWGRGGAWDDRRAVLIEGLRSLAPDVIGFQEAIKTDGYDQVTDLLGPAYTVVSQTIGLIGDGNTAAIASRFPVREVREVDLRLTPRTADFPATTIIAEILAPEPVGPLLFVNHLPSWKPPLELERELQAVAAARAVEEMVAERPRHVVLAGDLDAVPEAASIRFLAGRQSLGGMSVCYRDVWAATHPGEPGHTFTQRNPLLMEESHVTVEESRRIDYVFVRCDDRGPSLVPASCRLMFDEPVRGVWGSDHFGIVADLVVPS
jgi:endonuclease/exonuclease/phosphatase family metal-dependent hydrolase